MGTVQHLLKDLDDKTLSRLAMSKVGLRLKNWRSHPTVRELESPEASRSTRRILRDDERNAETRLPDDDSINAAGLLLAEAFTPSTVGFLERMLTEKSFVDQAAGQDFYRQGRTHAGARSELSAVTPKPFWIRDTKVDESLPPGVEMVKVNVHYLLPSLTIVIGSFMFTEEAGDLSTILRTDFETTYENARVTIPGRLGRLRTYLPWARPARAGTSHELHMPDARKRAAVDHHLDARRTACAAWFYAKFKGRFALESQEWQPSTDVLLTLNETPFGTPLEAYECAGLSDTAYPTWKCSDVAGWMFTEDRGVKRRRSRSILAARGSELNRPKDSRSAEDAISNWTVMHDCHEDQSGLIARWAAACLLSVYERRFARFRDEVTRKPRFAPSRPVNEARELDRFLQGDCFDAASICADLHDRAGDLAIYRHWAPEYVENLRPVRGGQRRMEPLELLPELHASTRLRANQVFQASQRVSTSIKASAELRQAISNIRLQRRILLLTVAATGAAVIALFLR